MRLPFRRQAPALPGAPVPGITWVAEAHIAVGSLAHIAPSDIAHHVLLVTTRDGDLSITGTACDHAAAVIVTMAASVLARRAHDGHSHEGAS